MGFPQDDRRPSVASATTVSSSGSKSSIGRGFHKQLRGFFGDEFPGDSRQGSDTSLTTSTQFRDDTQSSRSIRNRNNSVNSRPTSPTSSRPRTPLPSSEVTPWDFQDFKVRGFVASTFWHVIVITSAFDSTAILVMQCRVSAAMVASFAS
jgi:adenylate cyclase